MSDARSELVARNEASYRELNDQIQGGAGGGRQFQLVCECGDADCTRALNIDGDAYATVRAHPRRFIVLPGHEIEEVEDVVDRHEGYVVVEKPADVAHIVDPGGEGELGRLPGRARRRRSRR